MPRRLRRSRQVIFDLTDHYRYLRTNDANTGERFLDAAESMFRTLGDMPGIGRLWTSGDPRLTRIRVIHLPAPFDRHLVFYREDKTRVRILRVLHGARDLGSMLE